MDELLGSANKDEVRQELARLDSAAAKRRHRLVGQSPKAFAGYDAPQGAVIAEDHLGGKALIVQQGTLSKGSISVGEEVRSYSWAAVDWKPQDDPTIDKKLIKEGLEPEDLDELNPDDPGDGDEDAPISAYCAVQCFWYRGIPSKQTEATTEDVPFSWDMNAGPMSATYSGNIIAVTSLGGSWLKSNDGRPSEPCPTDVTFSDNEIFYDFDFPYSDNQGTCSYTVTIQSEEKQFGPPLGTDPKKWRSLCGVAPIRHTIYTDDESTLITVSDQNGTLAILKFEPNQVEFYVRCKEEGPP